jgi:hypothetical protein
MYIDRYEYTEISDDHATAIFRTDGDTRIL